MYHTRALGIRSWPRLLPKFWAGAGLALALLPTLALALLPTLAFGSAAQMPTVGSWTYLANQAPEPIGTMLLLTDGTVIGQGTFTTGAATGDSDTHWFKLTPDASGNYVNGTWTQIASMHTPRTYYASTVMRDGRVFVSGGEYTDSSNVVNTNATEIYDPVADTWTVISPPPGWNAVGDAPVKTLFDGTVLLGNIYGANGNTEGMYDYSANAWSFTGAKAAGCDEESWALLPDQSVLTVEIGNTPFAERYLPSSNSWVSAGRTPVDVVQSNEIGPAALLPNGMCLFIGATGHTSLYDYTNASNPWMIGPDFPSDGQGGLLEAKDAPGCVMVNGKVLSLVAPNGDNPKNPYPNGQEFFEYAYDSNGGTLTAAPDAGLLSSQTPAFTGRMLALPSGQVLYSNFNSELTAYTPDGGPDPSWKPVITSVAANADGSYLVSGTQFNGLTEGAYYGDDAAMSTNYPLVRLTDGSGVVTYARTFNHSTMGVATGSLPVSTNFTVPSGLANGTYQLQVVANGIASAPVSFTLPFPATDVSGQVSLRLGGARFDRVQNLFRQTVTLTNTGSDLTGPVSLVLENLSAGVGLFNASGATSASGSPYLNVPLSNGTFAANTSISVSLAFYDPRRMLINYDTRVLAGPGAR